MKNMLQLLYATSITLFCTVQGFARQRYKHLWPRYMRIRPWTKRAEATSREFGGDAAAAYRRGSGPAGSSGLVKDFGVGIQDFEVLVPRLHRGHLTLQLHMEMSLFQGRAQNPK